MDGAPREAHTQYLIEELQLGTAKSEDPAKDKVLNALRVRFGIGE